MSPLKERAARQDGKNAPKNNAFQENQPSFQSKCAFDNRSYANQSWKVSLRFWEVAAFKHGKTTKNSKVFGFIPIRLLMKD